MKFLFALALTLPISTAVAGEGGHDAFALRTPGVTTSVAAAPAPAFTPRRTVRRRASLTAQRRRAVMASPQG